MPLGAHVVSSMSVVCTVRKTVPFLTVFDQCELILIVFVLLHSYVVVKKAGIKPVLEEARRKEIQGSCRSGKTGKSRGI